MVEIDDESLARLGRWPWPRARLGEMIEKISALARPWSRSTCCSTIPATRDDDARLAKAIQGRPVVLGEFFTNDAMRRDRATKAGFAIAGDDPSRFATFPAR